MNDSAKNQPADSQNGTRDLFLSYNSRDREAVLRVWKLLEARAVNTFLDRNDLTPGLPWQAELECNVTRPASLLSPLANLLSYKLTQRR